MIDGLAGPVNHVGAHLLQHQLKRNANQSTDRQDHQGRVALAGHHAVIHLHGEHGPHQTHDADDEGGQYRIKKHSTVLADCVDKPVARCARGRLLAGLGHHSGFEHEHMAARELVKAHLNHLALVVLCRAHTAAELAAEQQSAIV